MLISLKSKLSYNLVLHTLHFSWLLLAFIQNFFLRVQIFVYGIDRIVKIYSTLIPIAVCGN